ncbi:uncharacterized protein CLUP02_05040 [Colletotrichum lupini]|uniref:Uncharacterized protein n=1 Tax=Colletotrichum lupini TaxID=145971 RepID=A0A9Q8SLV9_9PEZI|nr:uncharacterized protein CLUP02_05040 [Colletotrichum lupini]UQC79560.1 hypothetical protein CLUP02_05040 [Colletotrichum lupini]
MRDYTAPGRDLCMPRLRGRCISVIRASEPASIKRWCFETSHRCALAMQTPQSAPRFATLVDAGSQIHSKEQILETRW